MPDLAALESTAQISGRIAGEQAGPDAVAKDLPADVEDLFRHGGCVATLNFSNDGQKVSGCDFRYWLATEFRNELPVDELSGIGRVARRPAILLCLEPVVGKAGKSVCKP